MMRIWEADLLATGAHKGQTDKLGEPYVNHVRAVARGLQLFPPYMVIAGLLHDTVEDTDWTVEHLHQIGVPEAAVRIVSALTKQPGSTKKEQINRVIAGGPDAVLVKISDNAHNSHPDRAARLPEEDRLRLADKYKTAREALWPHAKRSDIETILTFVNPALLEELKGAKTLD